MKRLILFELIILFLATTFESDTPPGWFQQSISVNKTINDIFFLDSTNGWAVTAGASNTSDTAYILYTTNGGNNWLVQKTGIENFTTIQFLDQNTGYAYCKMFSSVYLTIYKTTNSGNNWQLLNNIVGYGPSDIFFVNQDTGWASDYIQGGAGLQKTTNGGLNWTQQLSGSFGPSKLFFINKDTGWAACQNVNLYRTTNGGLVWTMQFAFAGTIGDVAFLNNSYGLVTSGINQRTTDGGFTWFPSQNSATGLKLDIISDSITYAGLNFIYVVKTTNGGKSWFNQTSPINNNQSVSAFDSSIVWAGGSGIVHTTDGGGPPVGITQTSNEIPINYQLYQNYPNPFNPVTNMGFRIANFGLVTIKIFDITGKEIAIIVNEQLGPGEYKADWNATGYASGIYFYSLLIEGKLTDTKRMVLIK